MTPTPPDTTDLSEQILAYRAGIETIQHALDEPSVGRHLELQMRFFRGELPNLYNIPYVCPNGAPSSAANRAGLERTIKDLQQYRRDRLQWGKDLAHAQSELAALEQLVTAPGSI